MDRQLVENARHFLIRVVPKAAVELKRVERTAQRIRDAALRQQALASIAAKDFHVHGGCILATFLPPKQAQHYVRLVAAFQTAVDYLDNLCDRAGRNDEADFRALHEALMDAIEPGTPLRSYFRLRANDDGGYLSDLVVQSQSLFAALPSYHHVLPYVRQVTARYCELQAIKHLVPGIREKRCIEAFSGIATDLKWWESSAACGSTMPTFALAFGAMRGCDSDSARELYDTYFPYISALNILLDYFIDQAEDRGHGELNFVSQYASREAARDGLAQAGRRALAKACAAQGADFHAFAVRAMTGFYCSRSKIAEQGLGLDAAAIAAAVDVELGETPWRPYGNAALAPLLTLYRRVIGV